MHTSSCSTAWLHSFFRFSTACVTSSILGPLRRSSSRWDCSPAHAGSRTAWCRRSRARGVRWRRGRDGERALGIRPSSSLAAGVACRGGERSDAEAGPCVSWCERALGRRGRRVRFAQLPPPETRDVTQPSVRQPSRGGEEIGCALAAAGCAAQGARTEQRRGVRAVVRRGTPV
uniref:Uncharacterized protein n=1 Tax=Aegilops tauschii subsp. strangulata TaxID=200361 RepID=A0A453P8K3_AEGTS